MFPSFIKKRILRVVITCLRKFIAVQVYTLSRGAKKRNVILKGKKNLKPIEIAQTIKKNLTPENEINQCRVFSTVVLGGMTCHPRFLGWFLGGIYATQDFLLFF